MVPKTLAFNFIDGKGLIPALIVSIGTTEAYQFMKSRDFGKISMPPSVPSSLSNVFASLIPGLVIIAGYTIIFAIFNSFGISMPAIIFQILSPALKAADSLFFVILITVLTHFLWFFVIHDAALAGIVGPIRDGNLSINASAKIAGESFTNYICNSVLDILCCNRRLWSYFSIRYNTT